MAEVLTVADPRVVSESGVIMNQYVGPLNWEHYKIPASGLSNTQITFANLVTLGTNRIYDSGFQIEYTIEIVVPNAAVEQVKDLIRFHPFPLHWVTDQLRTNINGAACMSRPQESLPQRMMYWRQNVLDTNCSYCPHTKTPAIMDSHLMWDKDIDIDQAILNNQMKYGINGSQNVGTPCPSISFNAVANGTDVTITATFREPILCPPFNQRLDRLYQCPLYNITSIDIVYQLNDLRAMLESTYYTAITQQSTATTFTTNLLMNMSPSTITSINIKDAQLCFNVASLPPGMTVPPSLDLPYYDNVCYVTNANVIAGTTGNVTMTSGVYTLAQVPTAIYIFVSPNQLYRSSGQTTGRCLEAGFCPIRDINITMGNNTQLLTTTTEFDRYQMALANGLEDVTWEEFTQPILPLPYSDSSTSRTYSQGEHSCKCMLRLIPGIDLLIPDKRLVGGSDAEQMVFQVRLTADVTGIPDAMQPTLALWIMFEYCGVLTIEPVHASIDMLPIKTIPPIGGIDVIPDMSITGSGFGGGEGSGISGAGAFTRFLKKIPGALSKGFKWIRGVVNNPLVRKVGSTVLNYVDPTGTLSNAYTGVNQFLDERLDKKPRLNTDANIPVGSGLDDDMDDLSGGTIIGGKGKLGKFYM